MFDNESPPSSRLVRVASPVAAAFAGVLFAVASLWSSGLGPVVLVPAAIGIGILIAFAKRYLLFAAIAVAAALPAAALVGQVAWSDAVLGLVTGMTYACCFLVALLVTGMLRARRDYVRRGWDLAFAEAREHDARIERAVARERESMAGEIHDGLGHRLTLIAVQAARLSLDEQLPDHARAEMQRIRENAAAASEALGETVRLLSERTSGAAASLSGLSLAEVIERARSSGVTVHSDIEPGVEDAVNEYTHAALLRALQEGLTNAAKHAPGAAVRVAVGIVGDEVSLGVRNPVSQAPPPSASTGHGMVALRHRVAILGGVVTVEQGAVFAVTVRLPCVSVPSVAVGDDRPPRLGALTEAAAGAERRNQRATRLAWSIPVAMLGMIMLVVFGYFVYATFASVLPPERFAAIEVGDARSEVERSLPPMEMLDPPRAALPEPGGSTCRYYEASRSFFERDDVYRVCFAGGRVVAVDMIPAP